MKRERDERELSVDRASPAVPERKPHVPEAHDNATWASNVATNLEQAAEQAATCIEAIDRAHAAGDVAAYTAARESAELAVNSLRQTEKAAREHAHETTDPDVRERLEQGETLLRCAERELAATPPAPSPTAPGLHVEAALISALPPAQPTPGASKPVFDKAREDVRRVLWTMPFSDFAALKKLLRDAPTHEIAVRFRRFAKQTQDELLAILDDDKNRVRARDAEASGRRSPPSKPTNEARIEGIDAAPTATAQAPEAKLGAQVGPEIAERGVQGPGQSLPHGAQIQAAFGKHDVSEIRAHVGGDAAEASNALGARAYAFGDDIAFAESPSVATAAHEATHHIQQRAGVALKGKLDEPGDAYEQQADDIAGKVAHGQSVEHDLDLIAAKGSSASPTTGNVQREMGAKTSGPPAPTMTTPDYVEKHRAVIVLAVMSRIIEVGVPQPHGRLRWITVERGVQAVTTAISDYVEAAPGLTLKRLMSLAFPADLFAIVDKARRGPGGLGQVAAEIARALDVPLTQALERMGTRVVSYRDAHGASSPVGSAIVASSALDGVIGDVITKGENILFVPGKANGDVADQRFADGAAEIGDYEIVGKRDPTLWNWILVKHPKNPTVEQVARTPFFGSRGVDNSEQANRIAASPPYFGIPFETAKRVPEMFDHAPREIKAKLADGSPGPRVADDTALAKSTLAKEAALAEAPQPQKTDEPSARTLKRCRDQIAFLEANEQRFKLGHNLAAVRAFLDERQSDIAANEKDAQTWQAVLAMQERILHAASSEVGEIIDSMGVEDPKNRQLPPPVVRAIRGYIHAAQVSHLGAQAPTALAKARNERALLPLALTEYKIQLAGQQVVAEAGTVTADQDKATYGDLTERAADMRLKLARGGTVSAEESDQLSLDADGLATNSRIGILEASMTALMAEADAAGEPDASYENGVPTVRLLPNALRAKSARWREETWRTMHAPSHVLDVEGKRSEIARINSQITRFGKEAQLEEWRDWAEKHIEQARTRKLVNTILTEIGIMVLTGQIAGAAVSAFRGVALANGMISQIRSAGMAFKAGEVAIHAGLNTGVQLARTGDAGRKDFGQNALAIVLGHALMKPFSSLLGRSSEVEQAVAKSWRTFANKGAKVAVEIPLQTATGLAAAAIAQMAFHHDELTISSGQEWVTEGLSVAASMFVGQRTQRMHERITKAVEAHGRAKDEKLLARVDALMKRSQNEQPSAEETLAQLVENHALLGEELRMYGDKDTSARENRKDTELDGSFLEVPLQLKGLSPVVDGHIYEGTPKQIKDALAAAEKVGIELTVVADEANGVWHLYAPQEGAPGGRRAIELHTIGVAGRADGKRPAAENASDATAGPKPIAGLDGAGVAAQVPGTVYEAGGTFRITTEHGTVQVSIRRTNGPARVHRGPDGIVIEIPLGLTGTALEHTVTEQLRAAREIAKTTAPTKAKKLTPVQEAELLEWVKEHEQAQPPEPGESEKSLQMWKERQQEIRANYEKVMRDELDPPALHELFGGDREKAKTALRNAWEKGIPLTYHAAVGKTDPSTGKVFESAEEAKAALQSDLQAAFSKGGVTDATVQQIGSGTTGWRGNPGTPKKPKPIEPWNPRKDTDFAVFSEQAQYQLLELSKQRGQPPALNVPRDGKYTIFKSGAGDGGFYDTPVGRALYEVALRWNKIVYNETDPQFEGFDFKLNVPTKPFGKAVNMARPELPHLGTQPIAPGTMTSAEVVSGKGTNKYLGVEVQVPKEMLKQLPPGTKGRIEYHVTLLSPPEMSLLSDTARASVAQGVVLGGAPRLKGNIEKVMLAHRAPVEWPEANAFRHSLELQSRAEVEAALLEKPGLAKSVDLSTLVPMLKDGDLHVTLTGGVNEAIEQRRDQRPDSTQESAEKPQSQKSRATEAIEQKREERADSTQEGASKTPSPKPAEERDGRKHDEVTPPEQAGGVREAEQRAKAEHIATEAGEDFKSHPLRKKYEAEVEALAGEAERLIAEAGGDQDKLKNSARKMWKKRREISTRYKEVTPDLLREYIYWKNERRKGYDKLGPTWEYLEKNKTHAEIIRGSATPNADINSFLAGFRTWLLADGAALVK